MKKLATVDRNICVACGVCVKVCPKRAVAIHRGCYTAAVDEKCVGCGICVKACPTGCITLQEKEEAPPPG